MIDVKNMIVWLNSYYIRFSSSVLFLSILVGGVSSVSAQGGLSQKGNVNSQEIVIDMESYEFNPSEITVIRGKPLTLRLNNQSFLVPHNFLLDDPQGVRVLEADISSGGSKTQILTVTEPGIYPFYCDKQLFFFPSHREEGMEGRLIVQ